MKKLKAVVKEYGGRLLCRFEHPAINIGKGESVTYSRNIRTGEVWVRKNGRLLTYLMNLKARTKEILMEGILRW